MENLILGSLASSAAILLFRINVLFIDHIDKEKTKTLHFHRLKIG